MPPSPVAAPAAATTQPAAATATGASSGSSGLGIGGFNPLATLEGNPYFSAGFGLAIMGTGLAVLRGAGKTAVTMAKRHLLITLEVTSKDRAYPWVLQWLTEQAQHTSLGQHLSVQTVVKKLANGRTTTLFEFLAFKADVAFWSQNKSLSGLSARSIVIEFFTKAVVLAYCRDT